MGAMLRFTGAGLVQAPTTLQIRVTRSLPGRVRADAPQPRRSLSDEEVRENVHHFTVGKRGPRTRPCAGLVLSGVALGARAGLGAVLAEGRLWGLERVTLHLGRDQRHGLLTSPLRRHVDDLALTITTDRDVADVGPLVAAGLGVTAVVPLEHAVLPRVDHLAAALATARPTRVVFTWPLHAAVPPLASKAVAHLPSAIGVLDGAGVPAGIKGLPLCALGDLAHLAWRSANRWYVDAEHQGDDALLFFPDVVRFSKVDDCRFCAADERCDGAPATHLRSGRAGRLAPIPPNSAPSSAT